MNKKKVFTGLDLEIEQGQYVMLMGRKWDWKSSLISLLTGFKQGRIWSHSFLREGPQRMAEGQTSKTQIFIVASESSFRMWMVSYLIVLSMMRLLLVLAS